MSEPVRSMTKKKKRQVLYKQCNFSFREQKEYKGGPVDLSLNFFLKNKNQC